MAEARINELERRLADAIVLEAGESCDEVMLGIPVTVRQTDSGQTRSYTIVSPEELDEVDNGASEESPIGSALLGKKAGDVVQVEGPRGVLQFEIVSVGAS